MLLAGVFASAGWAADAKFEIDAVLKSGMEGIRKAVIDNHTLITHRRFPPQMAAGLARRIGTEVERIQRETKVAEAARKDLDAVLQQISGGVAQIVPGGAATGAIDGLFQITGALEFYAARFDHPGWMPIQAR